jgi:hypothetical protein
MNYKPQLDVHAPPVIITKSTAKSQSRSDLAPESQLNFTQHLQLQQQPIPVSNKFANGYV